MCVRGMGRGASGCGYRHQVRKQRLSVSGPVSATSPAAACMATRWAGFALSHCKRNNLLAFNEQFSSVPF